MKAMDVLLFLMGFNISLNIMVLVVGEGASPAGANMLLMSTEIVEGVPLVGVLTIGSLAAAIAAASITIVGSQASKPIAMVVFAFAGFYAFLAGTAMTILGSLMVGGVRMIPSSIFWAFVGFNIFVFITGIMQLISGGWRSSK